jgi:uncharacterized protein involved in exopolysaccharide biosynthesis
MSAGSPDAFNNGEHRGAPITLLSLINAALRRRKLIVLVCVLAVVIAAAKLLIAPRTYDGIASFTPGTPSSSSTISGLAAQFGVAIPSDNGSQGPAFYAELLQTRPLLQGVIEKQYDVVQDGRMVKQMLVDYTGLHGADSVQALESAVVGLRSVLDINVSQRTGIVSFRVRQPTRELARQVARNLLDAVADFDVSSRRTAASEERKFTERRLEQVKSELDAAEQRLLDFQRSNRSVQGDPALALRQSRLTREVDQLQSLSGILTQSYEHAKIDEVRDTPTITIIEQPENSVLATRTAVVKKIVTAGALGFVSGLVLAFLTEVMIRDQASDVGEREEFARLKAAVRAELLPWRKRVGGRH